MHGLDLIDMDATPDDRVMSDFDGDLKTTVPTHGHLDHIAAILKLAHRYDVPVVVPPFTLALVEEQTDDEGVDLEFVSVTHSTIDVTNPALHTPDAVRHKHVNTLEENLPPTACSRPNRPPRTSTGRPARGVRT
jgi:ribonuclease J